MPSNGRTSDDPSSAPESGTVRDETSRTNPSDRGNATSPADTDPNRQPSKDDPSRANEEK